MTDEVKIGVLALQGDFAAHCEALRAAGARPVEVRTADDLRDLDGLVLPGGESTTMLKLLDIENLFEPLMEFGRQKPVFGTCAGAILLAKDVLNPVQRSLGLMDLTVERNAYGRQIDSRISKIDIEGHPAEAVFIRAPVIRRAGPEVSVLATYQNFPVLASQGHHMVATFHPELSTKNLVHSRFVDAVRKFRSAELAGATT
ncbi:MAG: pyridoxal 5'-phosphate synthase glutaminase subunit PdxT [Bryobacteraceae bacterium]